MVARVRFWFVLLSVAAGSCMLLGMQPAHTTINVEKIRSGEVILIGDLGVPIGDVVEVAGRWVKTEKTGDGPTKHPNAARRFEIISVDRKKLDAPIVFRGPDVQILMDNDAFLRNVEKGVIAYETLRYGGLPPNVWDRLGRPVATDRKWGPYTHLTIVNER